MICSASLQQYLLTTFSIDPDEEAYLKVCTTAAIALTATGALMKDSRFKTLIVNSPSS